MPSQRSRSRRWPTPTPAELWLLEVDRDRDTCRKLSDLLRARPALHEMGGVVAGASVLTEACGPRLCGRAVEDLAAGDALVGWDQDGPGLFGQTVEAVRSRDAPPVLMDIRTERWRIVVPPHQLLQMYVCAADVWHDYMKVDFNLDGGRLSLKTDIPFVEPRLI